MGTGNVEEYNMGHSVSHRGKWGFGRFVSFICGGREDRLEPSIREVTAMDQQKIGSFLKTLRSERGMTQEELADRMNVSRRTVSRWETGSNMPDLAILVEIADLYDVDLREIFNGERKTREMNDEMRETMLMASDYTNENKEKFLKRMRIMFIIGTFFGGCYLATLFFGPENGGALYDLFQGYCVGIMFGMMIVGIFITGKSVDKILKCKGGCARKE